MNTLRSQGSSAVGLQTLGVAVGRIIGLSNGPRASRKKMGTAVAWRVAQAPFKDSQMPMVHSQRSTPGMCAIAMAALPTTTSLNKVRGIRSPNPRASWWQGGGVSSTWHSQTSWLATKFLCLAGLGLKLQGQRRSKEGLARRALVLPAAEFEHLFEEGPTELAYAGTPVSGLTQHEQGRLCQEWAKKVLQEQNPQAEMLDPEPGTCCNGRRRGSNQTLYDFSLDRRRVEIKSARMGWSSRSKGGYWRVDFRGIKLAHGERGECAFDDLYLALLSPRGSHLIKHDLVTGVSTSGERTEVSGHVITVSGSTTPDGWEDALDYILEKLCERGGCRVVHEQHFSDLGFKEILSAWGRPGQAAIAGIPMSCMNTEKRGKRIQEVASTEQL